MQKEELLQIHLLLIQIRKYYEYTTHTTLPTKEYDALDISPIHIHKNKNLHRVAVMTLGKEIVAQMKATMQAQNDASENQKDGISADR